VQATGRGFVSTLNCDVARPSRLLSMWLRCD
jgi:hypothetical protein